jgi:hypothetical protein
MKIAEVPAKDDLTKQHVLEKRVNKLTKGSLAKGDSPAQRKKRQRVIEETYGNVPIR